MYLLQYLHNSKACDNFSQTTVLSLTPVICGGTLMISKIPGSLFRGSSTTTVTTKMRSCQMLDLDTGMILTWYESMEINNWNGLISISFVWYFFLLSEDTILVTDKMQPIFKRCIISNIYYVIVYSWLLATLGSAMSSPNLRWQCGPSLLPHCSCQ